MEKLFSWELCEFRKNPSLEVVKQLFAKFDQLFSIKIGYEQLGGRINKTKENKEHLLKVLILPEIPLHNNAEFAARATVRKRDVSLQTIIDEGTKANDNLMKIFQTPKELGMSTYQYIFDGVSNKLEMLSLAQLIREKSSLSGKSELSTQSEEDIIYLK
ncbi:conserved protein [Methanosarcina mazei Go1]|nr:hypothetical protein [Methanosarcina mazei]AAM30869.1 conserved protein [Methanosarcina mazei Go1]WIM47862.1 hypothetical protein PQQ20_06235 [Methanosarcina mazei]